MATITFSFAFRRRTPFPRRHGERCVLCCCVSGPYLPVVTLVCQNKRQSLPEHDARAARCLRPRNMLSIGEEIGPEPLRKLCWGDVTGVAAPCLNWDVWRELLHYLSWRDILVLRATCHSLRDVVDHMLWTCPTQWVWDMMAVRADECDGRILLLMAPAVLEAFTDVDMSNLTLGEYGLKGLINAMEGIRRGSDLRIDLRRSLRGEDEELILELCKAALTCPRVASVDMRDNKLTNHTIRELDDMGARQKMQYPTRHGEGWTPSDSEWVPE